jgi:hypothetical protein
MTAVSDLADSTLKLAERAFGSVSHATGQTQTRLRVLRKRRFRGPVDVEAHRASLLARQSEWKSADDLERKLRQLRADG